jgi:hypothetical protein
MQSILLLALAIFCSSATAGWVQVSSSGGGVARYYVDTTETLKSSTFRRAWQMVDLAKPDSDGMHSMRGLLEFDCNAGRLRWLSETWYSGSMGSGRVIKSDKTLRDWRIAENNSSGLAVLRYVCSN